MAPPVAVAFLVPAHRVPSPMAALPRSLASSAAITRLSPLQRWPTHPVTAPGVHVHISSRPSRLRRTRIATRACAPTPHSQTQSSSPSPPPPSSTASQSHADAEAPQGVMAYFLPASAGERLFAEYQHPMPTGTAKLAEERGVTMQEISRGYGHILATTVCDDMPVALNITLLSKALLRTATDVPDVTAAAADAPSSPRAPFKADLTALSRLMTRAHDKEQTLAPADVDALSAEYGAMLGDTIVLSSFEMHAESVVAGLQDRMEDVNTPFPMPRDEYDTAFAILQSCAAMAVGTAAVDSADKFFGASKGREGVADMQADGYVLAVTTAAGGGGGGARSTADNKVTVAIRVRLLDGRTLLEAVPAQRSDPPTKEQLEQALTVAVSDMMPPFAAALTGLAVGETRTVFYHPYAAHDILPLFVPKEQIPEQAGLVVDLYLLSLE